MPVNRVEQIKELLRQHREVYVGSLSKRFGVSEVSIRKDLTKIENQGFALRFHGGASLVETDGFYSDHHRIALARQARNHIVDGDSIFIGSGRSCCVLARELTEFENLTIVTNNISALPELVKKAARVYLIGGEVASTDQLTLFSSWESPHSQLGNIFVNKAFTSIAGLDIKAGLTVDSIISTYIFQQIPTMARRWYLIADAAKFDKISIHQVADFSHIHTLITDGVPQHYMDSLASVNVEIVGKLL